MSKNNNKKRTHKTTRVVSCDPRMLTKEAITANIQNGFEAISNPEYWVELRVLPWFIMGPLRLPRCSSILSVGIANHPICTKTWKFHNLPCSCNNRNRMWG